MALPIPKQLITNETETITTKQIPSINTEQTFHPDSIYRPFPKATRKFMDQTVQKVSQTLSLK